MGKTLNRIERRSQEMDRRRVKIRNIWSDENAAQHEEVRPRKGKITPKRPRWDDESWDKESSFE